MLLKVRAVELNAPLYKEPDILTSAEIHGQVACEIVYSSPDAYQSYKDADI